jgi:hypothetical protein
MCWLSGEPTLDEMLFDPTVITMMKRDGVAPDDVRVLLQGHRGELDHFQHFGGCIALRLAHVLAQKNEITQFIK